MPTRDDNPLGLGPRDRGEGSNTGSTEDTSYEAAGSDRYRTGEPRKDFRRAEEGASPTGEDPADPDVPSSDEP